VSKEPDLAAAEQRPWPRIGVLRRFGPSFVIVGALVAAGTVATLHENSHSTTAAVKPSHHVSNNPADNPELPIDYLMAKKAGTTGKYTWQQGCDRSTGRLAIPTIYAPPCVPAFTGKNGGATWSGVSSTTIRVVYYIAPPGDLASALTGATDPPAEQTATAEAYVAMLNKVFELYGRHVQLTAFHATGISTDAVAARADAITVGQQMHAFASLGGPGQTSAYEDQLAREHVICLGCGLSVPYSSFAANAPYLWDLLPAPDTLLREAFDFVVGQLIGKDAVYAGNPAFHHEVRRIGLVHYDQNPPVFSSLNTELNKEFAHSGLKFVISPSYLLDLSTLPSQAAAIIAHLKEAGVTTVVFAGDPIMPIYLTKAATAQDYFPEWVITGTVFTDTSTLGRYYDPKQWAHAFGISSLAVPTPITLSLAYRFYAWWYGTLPAARKTAGVILPGLQLLYLGIDMAGPKLTPATFQGALFRYPPSGGTPISSLIAFGYGGAPPLPAYAVPDDYTVIWYDAAAKGPDEEGVVGSGLLRYVNGGKRYPASEILRSNLHLFDPEGTATYFYKLPASDQVSAPSWPGSPVANG
jgi:hypothetical protein